MKKLLFTLTITMFGFGLFAAPVSEEAAKNIAVNFYKHYAINKTDYSVKEVINWQKDGVTTFYVFIFNAGGFAIIAADDASIPVLGYSTDEPFDNNNMPPNAKSWLEKQYSEQIKYIIDNKLDNSQTIQEWKKIQNNKFPESKMAVNPLCTTKWDQDSPFNALCPVASGGPGGRCYAGCAATAMAQLMKYWNYPTTGTGNHSYTSNYGTLSANFGATTYNWSSMPNQVSSSNTAVATIIYHCGVAVDMNYGPNGSGAFSEDVPNALINYFGYQNTTQLKKMVNYSSTNWIALLKGELNASRPMYYAGTDAGYGGHAFVCDGYDATDKFHFNWGWAGYQNGNYAIGNLNPATYQFNTSNKAIVGMSPASTPNAPVANFTANNTTPAVGGSVNFTDQSTNTPTSWSWSFSGGNPSTSTQQNPQNITYSTAGLYDVSLTVTNSYGSHSKTATQYINAGSLPPVWTKQNTGFSTTGRGIHQIFIVDPNIVWAVAYDGSSSSSSHIREFTKTTNGGTTWTPGTVTFTNSTNFDIANIHAISDQICYACMYPISGTGGKIMKTTNGGTSWTEQTSASFTNSFADFVHFFNTNDGVAVGDPPSSGGDFVIYTTSNGGTTWTQVAGTNIPNSSGSEAGLTNFYDAVGNAIWFGTSIGRVYKSTDKGLNWTVAQTNVGNDAAYPIFKDANTGFIILAAAPYTMKKTTDGGNTWTSINPSGFFVKRPALDFVPGTSSMWVNTSAGPNKGSSYSINDCASFVNIDTGSVQYTCIKFYDYNTGWAGGFNASASDGGIYKWNPATIVGSIEQTSLKNKETINIYPNPANDYVNIEFSGIIQERIMVNVYNLIGEKVLSTEFYPLFSNTLQLNMSDKVAGLYIITLDTGNNKIAKRLSVIK